LALNPSETEKAVVSHDYIHNRVNPYTNVIRPRETELGNFYFARNPDYLPGLSNTATPLVGISVDTGLATVYANHSSVPTHDRLTVRTNLVNITLTRDGTIFTSISEFLSHCPLASTEVGSTYLLNSDQLFSFPEPSKIDHAKALFSISTLGLATWYRNKSTVPGFRRDQIRLSMKTGKPIKGVRFISAINFIKTYPDTLSRPGFMYTLSSVQLDKSRA